MDGDGKADVFSYRASDAAWLVSYSGTSAWHTINLGTLTPTRTWLADLNGDGKADVFTHRERDNAWLVSYSGLSSWEVINHAYLNPDVTRFGDVTGDGRDDVFTQLPDGRWVRSNGGVEEWVEINAGSFQPATTWIGDLDGDGLDDVVAINADWSWAVSYGGTSAWQIINHGYLKPSAAQLVDLNGDGRSDIYAAFDDGSWRVSYSGTSAWTVVNNGTLDPSRTWLADLTGDGTADVFSIQNLTQWVVSSSATGPWQVLNNDYLPADKPNPPVQSRLDELVRGLMLRSPGLTEAQVRAEISAAAAATGLTAEDAAAGMLAEITNSWSDAEIMHARGGGDSNSTVDPGDYIQGLPQPNNWGDVIYSPSVRYRVVEHGHSALFSSLDTLMEAPGGGANVREVSRTSMPVRSGTVMQEVVNGSGDLVGGSKRLGAIEWAQSRDGDKYNSNFLHNTRIASGPVGTDANRQNCSQLVWAAYKRQGIDFNDITWSFYFINAASKYADEKAVYPKEIRNSEHTRTYKTVRS